MNNFQAHFFASQSGSFIHSSCVQLPLTGTEIANLPLEGQRPVKDEVALAIGDLGENIKTRRAVCMRTGGSILLAGYTHPTPEAVVGYDVIQFGKYGAVVAFRPTGGEVLDESLKKSLNLIGRQLCQHIVGKAIILRPSPLCVGVILWNFLNICILDVV